MGKRFGKGGNAASSSGGEGGLSDEELKALADKTSFSLENVKDFHEVKDLLVHKLPLSENSCFCKYSHNQCQDSYSACPVFHERLPGWPDVKGEDERDVCNHGFQEQGQPT